MAGIGVILNPHSRSNRKNPDRISEFGFIVGDKGSCHATQNISDVKRLAQEFKERKIEILGLSGGDGTYQKTLTIFLNIYSSEPLPTIALLGGGTMNNVVSCLGIKGTPEMILSRLIFKYHQDAPFKISELPILKINDHYGFLFGNGLLHRFLSDFNKVKGPTKWTAVRMLMMDMIHSLMNDRRGAYMAKRINAEINVDGKPWPFQNYTTVFAGTVETLGLGFHGLYRARKEAGRFQVVGCSLPPRQILSSFPYMLLRRRIPSEHWLDSTASEVRIASREPEGYMIDGEIYPPTTNVHISLGPKLKLIVE